MDVGGSNPSVPTKFMKKEEKLPDNVRRFRQRPIFSEPELPILRSILLGGLPEKTQKDHRPRSLGHNVILLSDRRSKDTASPEPTAG